MTIDDVSRPGNIIFLDPNRLRAEGFGCPICGNHPFAVLQSEHARGETWCLVVPMTSKGSRSTAIRIPPAMLNGTPKFVSTPAFIYSCFYATWYPAWLLLEACTPSSRTAHNGNRLTAECLAYVLRWIVRPERPFDAA
jgi:hypothetical protein